MIPLPAYYQLMKHQEVLDLIPIKITRPGGELSGSVVSPGEPHLRSYLSGFTNFDKAVSHHLRKHCVGILDMITVDAGARGNGVGSDLVAQFLVEAGKAGATALVLVCDVYQLQKDGFDLESWYKALGFNGVLETNSGPLMVSPPALSLEMRAEFGAELDELEEVDLPM